MSVGRICMREVHLAQPGESVFEAARRMRARGVGTLVILDGSAKPVGMVTDRDLALRVVAVAGDARATTVGEVMTEHPRTVSESAPIEAALSLMRSGSCRHLPVVNEDGNLVGIVSLDDILPLLAEEFGLIGGLLEREAPRRAHPARERRESRSGIVDLPSDQSREREGMSSRFPLLRRPVARGSNDR